MPPTVDKRCVGRRIGSYLMDSVIFWLVVLLVCIGVSSIFGYEFYTIVQEGQGEITESDDGSPSKKAGLPAVPLVSGGVIFIVGGVSAYLIKKLVTQLMRPKAPRNLPSLSLLETKSDEHASLGGTFNGINPERAKNQLAAAELYMKMKVKVGADERMQILREGVKGLQEISKADANSILALFTDEAYALEAYDVMEPRMLPEEEEFRRKLPVDAIASKNSVMSGDRKGGARQSLWFSRINAPQPSPSSNDL